MVWKNCSFFKPVYAGDTITVYLTAKEKINRGVKGRNIPSGVVKWLVEVVNQREETVCVATILTLVAKKSPFIKLNKNEIRKKLNALAGNSQPKFGIMTPQNMLEHLEDFMNFALGKTDAKLSEQPEEQLEKLHDWLYKHKPMAKGLKYHDLPENENAPLRYKNLDEAKQKFMETLSEYLVYYRENPLAEHNHPLMHKLNKEMWELFHRKHFTHHFEQFNLI